MLDEVQHSAVPDTPAEAEGTILAALLRAAQAWEGRAALADWLRAVEQAARSISGARVALVVVRETTTGSFSSSADFSAGEAEVLADTLVRVLDIDDARLSNGGRLFGATQVVENVQGVLEGASPLVRDVAGQRAVPAEDAVMTPMRVHGGGTVGLLLVQGFGSPQSPAAGWIQGLRLLAQQSALCVEMVRLKQRSDTLLQRSTALQTAVAHLAAPLELQTILETIVEEAGHVFGTDGTAIFLAESDGSRCAAHRGLSEAYLRDVARTGGEPYWSMMRSSGRPLHVPDLLKAELSPKRHEILEREGLRSMLALPLVREGTVFGGFVLYHKTERDYSDEELQLAETFTEQASVALHNAKVHQAADRARRDLEAVINSMSDGLLVYDAQGRILLSNPRMNELFGLREDTKLEGGRVRDFARLAKTKGANDVELDVYQESSDDSTGRVRRIVELQHPEPRDLDTINEPVVDKSGRVIGRVVFHHDVTRERDSQRAKDEFLNMLSHELRTPLTSIKGYAQILTRRLAERNPDDARALKAIDAQTDKMMRLIEDLLTVARAEKGRLPLRLVLIDPIPLVQSTIDALRHVSSRHELTLEVDGIIPPVYADAPRLHDVLVNLLENAIKYSPAGGPVIVRIAKHPDEVQFSVEDSGIGIPENKRERVFDQFYQVDSSNSRRFGGVGLGLHLCKLIVEGHGGRIWVESTPDKGSVFNFTLPSCA